MTLQRIEDLREPPVVGEDYLVPCVRYWYDYTLRWWPVIGPRHDDVEHLAFDAVHYHLDRRFLPPGMFLDKHGHGLRDPRRPQRPRSGINAITGGGRAADTMLAARPLSEFAERERPNGRGPYGGVMPAPMLRKQRCIIADAGFPPVHAGGMKFERFHLAYAGRRCGRDAQGRLICPHKGAVLDSLAPDAQGRVTCPLHGLAINVLTGKVVQRPSAEGRAAE